MVLRYATVTGRSFCVHETGCWKLCKKFPGTMNFPINMAHSARGVAAGWKIVLAETRLLPEPQQKSLNPAELEFLRKFCNEIPSKSPEETMLTFSDQLFSTFFSGSASLGQAAPTCLQQTHPSRPGWEAGKKPHWLTGGVHG